MVKHWRLKKLNSWTVQGPIVTRLMMHFLSYNAATLFLLLVVYGIKGSLAAIADQSVSAAPVTFWQQAAPVVICMLVMMPFMIWDLMNLTNRIAGPLFRFETLLKEYSRTGTLNTAHLREGDLLTEYQQHFNEFVEAIHGRFPETQPVGNAPVAESVTATLAFRKSV